MNLKLTSIIIAIDDAGSAGRALDYGLETAEALLLPVRLVHVVRSTDHHAAGVRRINLDDIGQAAGSYPGHQLGAELLDRALARAGARKVEVEPVLLDGEPTATLLRYLAECDQPMLVVGRRGQGRLRELLLGSVSDQLVRLARCPVMVVS
jgi:nucleotide-binding universal stress UspA family protein